MSGFNDDIKQYLPKYLTPSSVDSLIEGLKQFPENIDSRLFSDYLVGADKIYQGDGLKELIFASLPNRTFINGSAIVISNTCDINPENKRMIDPKVLYCPMINLKKIY